MSYKKLPVLPIIAFRLQLKKAQQLVLSAKKEHTDRAASKEVWLSKKEPKSTQNVTLKHEFEKALETGQLKLSRMCEIN